MCSIKRWPAYQASESMVSTEVDKVHAKADEIEPEKTKTKKNKSLF
jgi:hypothetical protein